MSSPMISPRMVSQRIDTVCSSEQPILRVLFVIPGDGQGSSMIFARRQALSLAQEGVDVSVFLLRSRTSPVDVASEFRRFRQEVARRNPQVIHAHFGTVTALFCALACGSIPLVVTYRGSDLNPPPASFDWKGKLRAHCGRLFSQLACVRAEKIICVSSQLRDQLWWRRQAAAILPSGVDPELFRPAPRLAARLRLGWDPAERVVLFNAGRDPRVKRLDLAQAAVERARDYIPGLRMEVLDGGIDPSLIPVMMNAADCLLVTSACEGSPTVVQEALASNLTIVSVDVGDVVERLRDVESTTVASADAEVLGRALARLMDPPRRSNGCTKVAEFSSKTIAESLKSIYQELS